MLHKCGIKKRDVKQRRGFLLCENLANLFLGTEFPMFFWNAIEQWRMETVLSTSADGRSEEPRSNLSPADGLKIMDYGGWINVNTHRRIGEWIDIWMAKYIFTHCVFRVNYECLLWLLIIIAYVIDWLVKFLIVNMLWTLSKQSVRRH